MSFGSGSLELDATAYCVAPRLLTVLSDNHILGSIQGNGGPPVESPDREGGGSRRRVRLADVAAAVGVSRSTASLVLRGSPLVADETRTKVLEAFEELGYVYNRAASSLRAQKTGSVGVAVTTVGNPFFAEVVDGIESTTSVTGRTAILGQHSESIKAQDVLLNRFMEAGVDGVIVTAAHDSPAQSLDRLTAAGVPVVLCSRRLAGASAAYVGADNARGAYDAAHHVASVHKPMSLAFIGGWATGSPYLERSEGLRAGLAAAGRNPDELITLPSPVSRHDAYGAAELFLDTNPDLPSAVFAYNDVVALGVASAVRTRGLVVGKDVLLTGFDDIDAAQFEQPPLSTVHVGAKEIGRAAAEMLINLIDGGDAVDPPDRILPSALRIRRSCGCSSGEGRP